MKKEELKLVKEYCNKKTVVTRKELEEFILSNFSKRKKENLGFYIFDLTRANIIYQLNNNLYKYTGEKKDFTIKTKGIINNIFELLYEDYLNLDMCIWQTSIVYEFMNLQPYKNYIFVEVDKFAIDNIYIKLKHKFQNVLPKSIFNINDQLLVNDEIILVSNFIKESPVEKKSKRNKIGYNEHYSTSTIFPSPKIEKILVDLYCDNSLLMFDKYGELKNIYESILNSYKVNFTKLFRYAKVRNVKEEIEKYIKTLINFNVERGEFFDK